MRPLQVFCGTGDHLWVWEREPVDSPAAIEAMLSWMHDTYGVSRLYWRGGQGAMWDRTMKVGSETALAYDWHLWKRHVLRDRGICRAAVRSAHARGMEIFLYTGMLEFGVQPDVGIVEPYLFEDVLRREHPEWCSVDRWGERRCPGALSLGYPEVRQALVRRYVRELAENGYDGITFYTYVENVGVRYAEEFGFNEPIAAEFAKRYPGVDIRGATLSPEQEEFRQHCRGMFVTRFLRELHAVLAPQGRRLSVILDSRDPDHVQPWWGKEIAGTGPIQLDWRTWVAEGIVDELWVQLGAPAAQRATLDLLLRTCRGTSVNLTVRTVDPFDSAWEPYVAAGVTPIAVITAPRNGIERYALGKTSAATLDDSDWKMRLQTLADIAAGRLRVPAKKLVSLTKDPAVLVRRQAVLALASLGGNEAVAPIEACLGDAESSVRIAAAASLARVHGPESLTKLLRALKSHGYFQMKMAAVEAVTAMGNEAIPALQAGCRSKSAAVREVCARGLGKLGRTGFSAAAFEPLLDLAGDGDAPEAVRYHAIDGLVGMRMALTTSQRSRMVAALTPLTAPDVPNCVRLQAAWGLGYAYPFLDAESRRRILDVLEKGFRTYGQGCRRSDAAFGWRVFGNAMLRYHGPGRQRIEAMRTAPATDPWLAWLAYQVVHVPQRDKRMQLISAAEAVEDHRRFAPPFPGWRSW